LSGLKSSNVFARVNRQAGLRNPTYGSAWSGVGWVEPAKPNKIAWLFLGNRTNAGEKSGYVLGVLGEEIQVIGF
jgi:hypothetical protein